MHIAPPGDFIALGKQGKSDSDSQRISQPSSKKLLAPAPLGKREASPSTSLLSGGSLVKRPKVAAQGHSQTFTPLGRTAESDKRLSPAPGNNSQIDDLAVDSMNISFCELLV